MNQDQVKALLLSIQDAPLEFSVIFSGKTSKKVNGLYKPDSAEIIIHNRNFKSDNMLIYTAIHEYAHHLRHCQAGSRPYGRAHNVDFWALFHQLLKKAEASGLYYDVFGDSPELVTLTEHIRQRCLYENGQVVKELGKLLLEADRLCQQVGGRFEDYIDRVLRIPRQAAKLAIKIASYDIDPNLGADNMKIVAGIRDPNRRQAAEAALLAGQSPDEVKARIVKQPKDEKSRDYLEKEKQRLQRTIQTLTKRLGEVEQALESL